VDDAARAAIEEALRGDWRALTAAPLPGVVAVRSIHTTVSQRKHSLTVNLLGVFSFVSVTELAHEGRVLYEPATGNVIVTDAGSATRVQASANSLEADPEKLRSLYAESFMITAAYRGSGGAVGDPDLTSSHSLLITRKNATVGDVNRFLEIPVALGLLTAAEARTRSAGRTGFGAATVYAENRYNEALCKRLFLDDRHKARKQEEYETAGRAALALLIGAQDADAYRRILADRNELWRELKNIGNVASFGSALAGMRPAEVETISSDYRCIIWWAESMSRMARVVEECESFFQTNPNVDRNDPRFLALRGKLAHAIVAVLKETKPQFGEPWGLIAMDRVLYPQSRARVQLTTNAFSLTLERGPTHLAAIGA
jgi:hypothetical protein